MFFTNCLPEVVFDSVFSETSAAYVSHAANKERPEDPRNVGIQVWSIGRAELGLLYEWFNRDDYG